MLRIALAALLMITSSLPLLAAKQGEKLLDANGFVLVLTRVNGKGPFLFLLDTGATSSAVTPAVARVAGFVPNEQVTVSTAAGQATVPAGQVELRVGPAGVSTEALILPLNQPKSIDPRIEGVLGQTFLSRFPCLIDYRGRRLWLGDDAVRRGAALPEKLSARRLDGRLAVEVNAGSSALRLVLDSGAPALVLSCGRHCPSVAEQSEGRLVTNAGSRKIVQGTLPSVSVGGIRIRRATTVLVDGDPAIPGEDGLLPARWFSAVYLGPGNTVALAK